MTKSKVKTTKEPLLSSAKPEFHLVPRTKLHHQRCESQTATRPKPKPERVVAEKLWWPNRDGARGALPAPTPRIQSSAGGPPTTPQILAAIETTATAKPKPLARQLGEPFPRDLGARRGAALPESGVAVPKHLKKMTSPFPCRILSLRNLLLHST